MLHYNWLVIGTDLQENAAFYAFRINCVSTLTLNIKSKAQQKKIKTIRGSYTVLDLSIHYKKRPWKSGETLPLSNLRSRE